MLTSAVWSLSYNRAKVYQAGCDQCCQDLTDSKELRPGIHQLLRRMPHNKQPPKVSAVQQGAFIARLYVRGLTRVSSSRLGSRQHWGFELDLEVSIGFNTEIGRNIPGETTA